MEKSVAIVGMGQSVNQVWQSSEEMWAVKRATGPLIEKGYPISRSYWLDSLEIIKDKYTEVENKLLHDWPYPNVRVKMLETPDQVLPHVDLFDIQGFIRKYNSDYINNSTAMAICDAALEGYTQIDLHGVDFMPHYSQMVCDPANAKDWVRQNGCVMYWIGRLERRADNPNGIRFRINPLSRLYDSRENTMRGHKLRGFARPEFIKSLPTTNLERYAEHERRLRFQLEEEQRQRFSLEIAQMMLDTDAELKANMAQFKSEVNSSVTLVRDKTTGETQLN
jgi:hypothetical protein